MRIWRIGALSGDMSDTSAAPSTAQTGTPEQALDVLRGAVRPDPASRAAAFAAQGANEPVAAAALRQLSPGNDAVRQQVFDEALARLNGRQ